MTTIAFVRHGNTDWNIEKRAQGHSHNPLNETGFKQARAVAERLAKEEWDLLLSSDLLRAKQTAEIISSRIGLPILYDERLRERNRGEIEGTIEEERIQIWGKDWRSLNLWQESYQSLRERGRQFVEDLYQRYPDKKILVVTHGFFLIHMLYELCPNETNEKDALDNTSITIIRSKNNGWEYLLYNSTSHLKTEEITN
ncbi:histidine phosphatase family protein [Neobacillus dielmonensis]|uniref:histidine phosphatase family protein n=1 Tax=Neobacillus dielmonensis TaxID=1347369 RepID=UPI0005A64FB7|nr:histidine phosphatase family protein [Neobacillus dielmonensis]